MIFPDKEMLRNIVLAVSGFWMARRKNHLILGATSFWPLNIKAIFRWHSKSTRPLAGSELTMTRRAKFRTPIDWLATLWAWFLDFLATFRAAPSPFANTLLYIPNMVANFTLHSCAPYNAVYHNSRGIASGVY